MDNNQEELRNTLAQMPDSAYRHLLTPSTGKPNPMNSMGIYIYIYIYSSEQLFDDEHLHTKRRKEQR